MVNCVVPGRVMPMRMRPLFNKRLWSAGFPGGVTFGQLAPPIEAKRGSLPPDFWKMALTLETPRPNASLARWQEAQERPLVPRLWKNGFFSLMGPAAL